GFPLGAQLAPTVLEVADQLLLLGVDRDGRLALALEALDTGVDVLELPVAVGVLEAFAGLGVGLQAEAEFLEQPTDPIGAGPIVHPGRGRGQMPAAAARPQQRRLRIASGGRGDELLERLEQAGLLDRCRLAAAALPPDPAGRHIGGSVLEFVEAAIDRAAR